LLERYAEPLNAIAVASHTIATSARPPCVEDPSQNHPHDSICGCSIDPVHREMMTRFAAVQDVGKMVVGQSLQHLLPADDLAAGDDRCVFLFNPSPVPRSEVAGAEVSFYLQDIVVGLNPDVKVAPKLPPVRGFALFDEEGQEVPIQRLSRAEGYDITYSNYNYPKQTYAERFSFWWMPQNSAPRFRGGRCKERFAVRKQGQSRTHLIENALFRVEVNLRGEIT
jgi:hypothetical protein